jgi:hypothetical protein
MITGERDLGRDDGLIIRRRSREPNLDRSPSMIILDGERLRLPGSMTIRVGDLGRDLLRVVGPGAMMGRGLRLRLRDRLDS